MSAPTHSDQDLSRREELSVSGAAMSGAPWGAATVTGGVVAAGDFALHVVGSGLSGFGLSGLSGSLALGAVAFFVVAAAGALWRARPSRAIRWARSNPWRFAVMPAVACAAIALVLSVVTGGGVIDGVLSGLWHGGAVYGLTGVARRSRQVAEDRLLTYPAGACAPVASAMPRLISACVTAPNTRSTMRCWALRKKVCGSPATP